MNTVSVARLLNVSSTTIHRWTRSYRRFLYVPTVSSNGVAHVFSERDVRVLQLVSQLRRAGVAHEEIEDRLNVIAADDWEKLPQAPGEEVNSATKSVVQGRSEESEGRDAIPLERVAQELQEGVLALQLDEARIRKLVDELESLQGILEEKATELGAKDGLIAEQRRTLQMAQVALMARAEQQERAIESALRRRLVIGLVLLLLCGAAAAMYLTWFH